MQSFASKKNVKSGIRARKRAKTKTFQNSYKAQHRVFLRWRHELTTMRLRARAKGDTKARIELAGLLSPGVVLGDGSLWMLAVGSAGRRETRSLFSGKVSRRVKGRRRQDGMYFGPRQGNGVCLLKPRPAVRFFGAKAR